MKKSISRALTIALILAFIIGFIGYQKTIELQKEPSATPTGIYNPEKNKAPQTEIDKPVLDCKSLEAACADSFIDPTKVTVLGGEWAYTADPNKFVALATVRYTDKDDEYEVAEIVMVGTFGVKTELFHHLNEHSPYTRENVLREFGAIDDQRFPLE